MEGRKTVLRDVTRSSLDEKAGPDRKLSCKHVQRLNELIILASGLKPALPDEYFNVFLTETTVQDLSSTQLIMAHVI